MEEFIEYLIGKKLIGTDDISSINEKILSNQVILSEASDWFIRKGNIEMVRLLMDSPHYYDTKNKNAVLELAIKAEQKEIAKLLVGCGADLYDVVDFFRANDNVTNLVKELLFYADDIDQALIIALNNKYDDLFLKLIQNGANVNTSDGYCLQKSAHSANHKLVKLLLDNGADVHVGDDCAIKSVFGWLFPSENDKYITIKHLLDYGADIHIDDDDPLVSAVKLSYPTIVRLLVESGANIHCRNDSILCAKHIYGSSQKFNEIFKYLIQNGANNTANDNEPIISAIEQDKIEIVELLIDHGANIMARDGLTINLAIRKKNYKILKLLVDSGAKYSDYLLLPAVESDKINIVKLIIENQSYPNDKYKEAIKIAVQNRNKKIIKLLSTHLVNIENNLNEGQQQCYDLILSIIDTSKFDSTTKLLLSYPDFDLWADIALVNFVKNGHEQIVAMLIKNGANVHTNNNLPIKIAAKIGHLNMAKLLVELGADINNNKKGIALIMASKNGHYDIVKFLIESGADIHASDVEDDALRAAAANGHYEIVKYLIEKGADPKKKQWILPYICARGYYDIVKLLLEYGVDPNVNHNESLKTCINKKNYLLAKLLIEFGANTDWIENKTIIDKIMDTTI